MNYDEIMAAAKDCVGDFCRVCGICDGRACGNSIPGPGCKVPGNTALKNYEAWQNVCVNMDTICEPFEPDTGFELFGHSFRLPVFAAPLGSVDLHYGKKYIDRTYNSILVKAAAEYGSLAFTGDGVNPEVMKSAVKDMAICQGLGVPTIKPWNNDFIFEKLDILNESGIFAVGMDVDGAGLPFLKALNPNAGNKSVSDLKEIVSYAKMPFIIKGIMTVKGALKAIEVGADAIVVSNHGGRVQGGVPSTCEVLPEIATAVNGQIAILVDGGIRSGVDVFRALALGADAVLIGRPILPMIYGAGEDGFHVYMDKIRKELADTMTMCGCPSLKDINRDCVRVK